MGGGAQNRKANKIQRIVTVNPQGWSRMAPLLSHMKEEVILVQETFLEPGKVAKAEYEAKAC
eukprot:3028645-Amphidinium_carterae.1